MPNGVDFTSGKLLSQLLKIIIAQSAGFGKRNFQKTRNFLHFFESADQIHAQKPQISQNLKIGHICLITARIMDTCEKIGLGSGGRRGENYPSPWSSFNIITPARLIGSARLTKLLLFYFAINVKQFPEFVAKICYSPPAR
jgi:hypothetical protein